MSFIVRNDELANAVVGVASGVRLNHTLTYDQVIHRCRQVSDSLDTAEVLCRCKMGKSVPVNVQPCTEAEALTVILSEGVQIHGVEKRSVSTVDALIQQR